MKHSSLKRNLLNHQNILANILTINFLSFFKKWPAGWPGNIRFRRIGKTLPGNSKVPKLVLK